jgi:cytochrome c biogenesis protein CcdA
VAVLVLGIASLVTGCCIGVIPAIVALSMAGGARREIAASGGRLSGDGFIKGGVICSWISIGLTAVAIVLFIGLIALGAFSDANFDDTGRGIQSSMAWLRP